MCGILGVAGEKPRRSVFERALGLLTHRGPDDSGVFEDAHLLLGHRRLSIIDLDGGRQPMSTPDGRFVLSFGGELYNYRELRRTLSTSGFAFRTESDTEVLLTWLVHRGVDGLPDLNGMFHFAFWDRHEKKLLLARDRLGIKPLYYALDRDRLIFASEIKALLPFLETRAPDREALFEFLTFQNVLSSRTFFETVRKLSPGRFLLWRPDGIEEGAFWEIAFPEAFGGDYEEAKRAYLETLEASVERHLRSDVEVGAYLSSGFDSSTVATLAATRAARPFHTFTGFFQDAPYYDEREGARAVARNIGAELQEIAIAPRDYVDDIENVIYHLDEPTLGTGALPHYVVSRRVSQSVKVVLTGHGGDEMFSGYQVSKVALLRETLARHPFRLASVLRGVKRDEWSRVLYYLLYPLLYHEVREGLFVMVPRRRRASFFTEDFLASNRDFEPLAVLDAFLSGGSYSPSQKLMVLYLRTYLPTLFIQEDKVSMAHSVESRTPLCDNAMLDLALKIPLGLKLHGNELKALTRDVMKPRLPELLYALPKRGFPTPFARWYRTEPLRSFMADLLFSRRTEERGILRTEHLRRLFERNLHSRTDLLHDYARANQLYSAGLVELWFRTFIDRDAVAPRMDETQLASVRSH